MGRELERSREQKDSNGWEMLGLLGGWGLGADPVLRALHEAGERRRDVGSSP